MEQPTVVIDCPECNRDFRTSLTKHIGEKFQCSHCGHTMKAESDRGEDGETIWYAATEKAG
jgi:DNA-directed RNA polymerase subunit M/transcription elongation factor TFIIS